MRQYLDLLKDIKENGTPKATRQGIDVVSVFGRQMRFDLSEGFPLLTTKKVFLRAIIHELLWFLTGSTNIQYLVRHDVRIWNEWSFQVYLEVNNLVNKYPRYSDIWQKKMAEFIDNIKNDDTFAAQWGDLGPVYGKQWIRWETVKGETINQIENCIQLIKNDATSRRIIVSGWNVGDIQELIKDHNHAPPPCHTLFHFMVINEKLSCLLYQRSCDMFLGVPFNIASYALLTMMMAQVCGLEPGDFVHTLGDAHLFVNHFEQADLQLSREPRPLPRMKINPERKNIFDFEFYDFTLEGYDPHPSIKAPIAV